MVVQQAKPRNRSEQEIAGYRDVLSIIHENYDYIPVEPNAILQLHRDLYSFFWNWLFVEIIKAQIMSLQKS